MYFPVDEPEWIMSIKGTIFPVYTYLVAFKMQKASGSAVDMHHDGDLVVSWNYCGTGRELSWNQQDAREILLVCQFYSSMGAELLYPKIWPKSWNNVG